MTTLTLDTWHGLKVNSPQIVERCGQELVAMEFQDPRPGHQSVDINLKITTYKTQSEDNSNE